MSAEAAGTAAAGMAAAQTRPGLQTAYHRLPGCRYMRALLSPCSGEGLDPAWLEPAPRQCRLGVELLSCSS